MLVPIKEKLKYGGLTSEVNQKVADLEDLISDNSSLPDPPKVMDSIDSFANLKWKEPKNEENKQPEKVRFATPSASTKPPIEEFKREDSFETQNGSISQFEPQVELDENIRKLAPRSRNIPISVTDI